jgi:hypothetical protein
MEKMFSEEYVDIAIVVGTEIALLKMVDPVPACILNIQRNMLVHFAFIYLSGTSP